MVYFLGNMWQKDYLLLPKDQYGARLRRLGWSRGWPPSILGGTPDTVADGCAARFDMNNWLWKLLLQKKKKKKKKTTTDAGIIHEIVYKFTDAMYWQHSAAVGTISGERGGQEKKKRWK